MDTQARLLGRRHTRRNREAGSGMILRDHFIYLEKQRFVFVHVPKVACTNWKALLRYISGFPDYLDTKLAHNKQKSGLVYLSNVVEWREILADPTIAKYS